MILIVSVGQEFRRLSWALLAQGLLSPSQDTGQVSHRPVTWAWGIDPEIVPSTLQISHFLLKATQWGGNSSCPDMIKSDKIVSCPESRGWYQT